jgi:hypothetical protein
MQRTKDKARSPSAENNFPLRTNRILLSKLDTRGNQISSYALLVLEQDPRHGRRDDHVEVLARASLLEVLLRSVRQMRRI